MSKKNIKKINLQFLLKILDITDSMVIVLDRKSNILYTNKFTTDWLNFEYESIINLTLLDISAHYQNDGIIVNQVIDDIWSKIDENSNQSQKTGGDK